MSTITTRPSSSERRKAAPMSTMPPPSHSLLEPVQRDAVHREGQAAFGPWNDSTKITIIGP